MAWLFQPPILDYVPERQVLPLGRRFRELLKNDPVFRLSTFAERQPHKNPATLQRLERALHSAGLPD